MNKHIRNLICVSILLSTIAVSRPVWAQKPTEEKVVTDDPAVQAILEMKSTSPDDMVRVAMILDDLGRPDLGKKYLQKLLKAKLSEKQLADLVDQFGSPMFLKMASRPGLQPESKQLADALFDAANRWLGDPKRLAELIKQLQDPSDEKRFKAEAGLSLAGKSAVLPLIGVLADPARAKEHANVRDVLVQLGADSRGPVLGTLDSKNAKLVIQMIRVIEEADDRTATIYLLTPFAAIKSDPMVRAETQIALKKLIGHVPTGPEVVELLVRETKKHFDAKQTIKTDEFDHGFVWTWDAAKKVPVARRYPADDARLMLAARFAKQAYAVAPGNELVRRLYLASKLELAAYTNGLGKPLATGKETAADSVATFGSKDVEDVLEYAMSTGHIPAATAAAEILGRIGSPEGLLYDRTTPGPLVRAAQAANRRLRFTAINAIMKLDPDKPFAGCSTIPKMLAFFASSTGSRRVLIAGVGGENEQQVLGYLSKLGYRTDSVVTGRELVERAVSSPDYEFVLIYTSIGRPRLSIVLQQLRHDCRTAMLPVGILARSDRLERAKRVAQRDPMAGAFPRPHSEQTFLWQIQRLAKLAGRNLVPHAERQRQAVQAVELLAVMSDGSQKVFNVAVVQNAILPGVYVPQLGTGIIGVLKNMRTSKSQLTLLDLASRTMQPLEVRKVAAEAFGESVKKYGILLTTDEIKQQYERYNQSKSQDKATQDILGAILDSIEDDTSKAKKKVGEKE